MNKANPILVELSRGDYVESRHRGACVVMNAHGEVLHAWGDVDQLVYPRSSLKPIQALALIETGAADHFGLADEEIALACASHSSEPFHVKRVMAWLNRIGLSVDDLECGVCDAISLDTTKAMSRAGEIFSRAHNNCSGKHTGFLSTALHMGEPTMDYIQLDHPVQKRVTATIEELCDISLSDVPRSTDGCGIPVFAFPLRALARGMAALCSNQLGDVRGAAAKRILAAMAAHPELIAGTKRFDTRMMAACDGMIMTKGGAEGVHIAMIPSKGLGIALKIDDGAIRASELAMGVVLEGLGVLSDEACGAIADLVEQPINTTLNDRVGEIRKGPGFMF